jgi:hypothetical protein
MERNQRYVYATFDMEQSQGTFDVAGFQTP